jgi:Zn-dependent M28 family amino/carboxypeptidase
VPLLQKWLKPFAGLGANSVVAGSTSGTDHVYFQRLGLPAFQFIQDPLDYSARLHHTNIDTFDHIRTDDLRQAATVMAGVLLQAANDEETLAREPLPQRPTDTAPFECIRTRTDGPRSAGTARIGLLV